MSARLHGSEALRRRLEALGQAFKPIGRKWGAETKKSARPKVPERTGRLKRSIRVTSTTAKKTRVGAFYTQYFVDAGVRPHVIKAKRGRPMIFKSRGKTVFARAVHHRGYRARPFRVKAAKEGLAHTHMDDILYQLWNDAA